MRSNTDSNSYCFSDYFADGSVRQAVYQAVCIPRLWITSRNLQLNLHYGALIETSSVQNQPVPVCFLPLSFLLNSLASIIIKGRYVLFNFKPFNLISSGEHANLFLCKGDASNVC